LEELLEGDAVALGNFLDAVPQAYDWAFFEGREILERGGAPQFAWIQGSQQLHQAHLFGWNDEPVTLTELVGCLNLVEGCEAFAWDPELGGEVVKGDAVTNPDPSFVRAGSRQGCDEDVKVGVAGCWRG
jgi:hypothetical protein